jgi:hypothetical protein
MQVALGASLTFDDGGGRSGAAPFFFSCCISMGLELL